MGSKLALEADLGYNKLINIVVSGGTGHTPDRINLIRRSIMDSLHPHGLFQQELSFTEPSQAEKQCTGTCDRTLPATTEYFYMNRKKGKLCPKCKECDNEARKTRQYKPRSRKANPISNSKPRVHKYTINEQGFWNKVDKSGECWSWTGALDRKGYGRFHTFYGTGKPHHEGAHRVAYILTYGDIPNGLHVCHRCDNPPCCNPSHLFLGTHADNMADMYQKGRNSPPPVICGDGHWTRTHPEKVQRGEQHPIAKLSLEQVRTIRASYSAGDYSMSQLGKLYGVNKTCISKIINNQVWKEGELNE